mmetsp:Transcript_24997/g.31376  ORF Transcript_24997/g.31376 Transcript_24997/m.31376 type:complete len:231 (-) Transcript_24997:89-781(-)
MKSTKNESQEDLDIKVTMTQETDKALDIMHQLLLEQPSSENMDGAHLFDQNTFTPGFSTQQRYDPTQYEDKEEKKDAPSNQWSALRDVFSPATVTKLGDGKVALSFAASGKQLEHKFDFGDLQDTTHTIAIDEQPSLPTMEVYDENKSDVELFHIARLALDEGRRAFLQINLEKIYCHYQEHHAALTVSFKRAKRKARAAIEVDIESGAIVGGEVPSFSNGSHLQQRRRF